MVLKKNIKPKNFKSYQLWGIITFLIFLGLGIGALTNGNLACNDQALMSLIQEWRNPLTTNIFLVMTYLGQWQMVLLIALLVVLILEAFKQRRKIALLLMALVSTLATSEVFKYLFHRSRPDTELSLINAHGYSFPSGHAVVSVVFYGVVCYFLWQICRRRWQRGLVIFLFSCLILSIGLSRIYLGVHWFSDVIGSWSLGLFWLILFLGLYQGGEEKRILRKLKK